MCCESGRRWGLLWSVIYSVHSCTSVDYYNCRSFCGVSGAELPEIVLISELSVFCFGFLGSGHQMPLYSRCHRKLAGRCEVLLSEKYCSHVPLKFSIET